MKNAITVPLHLKLKTFKLKRIILTILKKRNRCYFNKKKSYNYHVPNLFHYANAVNKESIYIFFASRLHKTQLFSGTF